jgi:hypothetical protein
MRTPTLVTLLATGVTVLASFAALRHQGQIRLLDEDVAALKRAYAAASAPLQPDPRRDASEVSPAGRSDLSETNRLELLRLRAEVIRLGQRQRELAPARTENASLKARMATNAPAAPPPGWVRRAEARFTGAGSPEAALQSFFWAIEHRDTNALLQLMTDTQAEQMRKAIEAGERNDFWEESRLIPGFRIVGTEARSDTERVVKVEFIPGEQPAEIVVRRVGQDWRLAP